MNTEKANAKKERKDDRMNLSRGPTTFGEYWSSKEKIRLGRSLLHEREHTTDAESHN